MKIIYLRPQKDPELKDSIWMGVGVVLMAPVYFLISPNLELEDLFTTGKGFLSLLFVVLVGIYIWRDAYKKQNNLAATPVEIDDQTITLPRSSIGKLVLHREEIVAVVDERRGLAIQVKDGSAVLNLGPEFYTGAKNYEAIQATLTAWAPAGHPDELSEPELKHIESSTAKGALPLLVGFIVTVLFNTPWVVVPTLLLMAGYLYFGTWKIWKELDAKSKRGYLKTLVVFSAYIFIRLFIVLKLNP